MKLVITIALSVALVLLITYLYSKIPISTEKYYSIIATLLIVVPFIYNSCIGSMMPEDYVLQNRPYLEPKLVITKIEDEHFYYSYFIKNMGKLPATNLQVYCEDVLTKVLQTKSITRNELAPGGNIKVKGNIEQLQFRDNHMMFELHLYYQTKIDGKEKNYIERFKFSLFKDEFREGEFICSESTRDEGEITEAQYVTGSDLDEPKGTLFLVFNERKVDSVKQLQGSSKRVVTYNPAVREVELTCKKHNGEQLILRNKVVNNESKNHIVIVVWNQNSCSLHVDNRKEVIGKL